MQFIFSTYQIHVLDEKLLKLQPNFPLSSIYGKCPKILYIKVSDKIVYANSADPDQNAHEGAVIRF